MNVKIDGVGSYLPENIVTNEDLSKIMDTNHEWIKSRTGIEERRISSGESTADLAYNAAIKAIENSSINKEEIDLIIVATSTSDYVFPSVANLLVSRLGLDQIMSFDLSAACTGMIFALDVAKSMIEANNKKAALIIGSETFSRIIDWNDRNTSILFGDGASAVILTQTEEKKLFKISSKTSSDNDENLFVRNKGLNVPWLDDEDKDFGILHMNGQEVFKFATRVVKKSIQDLLDENSLTIDDIKLVVSHQANSRIIKKAANYLGAKTDKFYMNLDKYGNTSAASIGIALDEAIKDGRIERNDKVILVGFGAGFAWGAAILEY